MSNVLKKKIWSPPNKIFLIPTAPLLIAVILGTLGFTGLFLSETAAPNTSYQAEAINTSSSSGISPSTSLKENNSNSALVNCGPGVNSGQYVKDKQSNCKNYVDCGINVGSTVTWTMMIKSECDKKHAEANNQQSNKNNINPQSGGSGYITISCPTLFGTYTQYGKTYEEAQSLCKRDQDFARSMKEGQEELNNISNRTYEWTYSPPVFASPVPMSIQEPSPTPCTLAPPGWGGFAQNPC